MNPVLVLGFGPFLEVVDNPASRLARALDGLALATAGGPVGIVGRVMPVTWRGCVAETVAQVAAHRPRLALGVGVARDRQRVTVERWGRRLVREDLPDVDGVCLADLEPDGPERREARIDVARFAAALAGAVSEDAGGYVCNAWLYQCLAAVPGPVGFLHVPAQGIEPERVCAGLRVLLGE